jgi:hypothetical protein
VKALHLNRPELPLINDHPLCPTDASDGPELTKVHHISAGEVLLVWPVRLPDIIHKQ